VDWGKRRGTVCSFTKRHEAYVLWDGRRSTEIVPIAILETVQNPRHRASDSDEPQATACSVGDIAAAASWLM
jgi:hypothetical protein